MQDQRPLATREEVADFLRLPARTLEQWAYRGTGPKYTLVGRHARYDWNDVHAYLQRCRGGGAAA
ncbi:helix-turn-helix transcriptional regulator [Amycolatopsis azurea]|uniref:Helix-turn-helix domain-containing protein n=2 Tax=Amycolatopsis azurea TaxID=36819 RepID=A0ABX3JJU9_9PSEU|nr:hypothetical protein B0293_07705 [Amycolatopsis azurea DSM 43854]